MTNIKFSLRCKLIFWLAIIGFITSFTIQFSLLMMGSSNVNYTMRQLPILHWQNTHITKPIQSFYNDSSTNNHLKVEQHFQSLINQPHHEVFIHDKLFTKLSITAFAFINLNSELVFQSTHADVKKGDVGSQIQIRSRDDLSDALSGRHNSGIEPLKGNNYLVIKPVINANNKVVGATISWQSWLFDENQAPLFYMSVAEAFEMSLTNTLASFFWILPSTFILGWLFAKLITQRYQHLYRTIEAWGNGELDKRIRTSGSDEIATSFERLNQMAKKLTLHQKELQQLASIEERQHLAAELHDTVKQQLFAANLQLSAAAQLIETQPQQTKLNLQQAIEQNRIAFQQINDLIFTLSPIPIGGSLKKTLIESFENWQQNNDGSLQYQIDIKNLTEIQQQIIFRSIMEALQNINKHSNAEQININIIQNDSKIAWSVSDNGSSFQDDKIKLGQGLYLMKQRIESLNGRLSTNIDSGFHLKAELPI